MTDEDMKRIVQECFDELETDSSGGWYKGQRESPAPTRGEKPVSGQKKMQSSIFGYGGSLGSLNMLQEESDEFETVLESDLGAIGCSWKAAGVSRPLHSVSKVAGPPGGIKNSTQDVLFNNGICVVVPPGVVAEVLKRVTPVASYAREADLYVGDMITSSFRRQGPQA